MRPHIVTASLTVEELLALPATVDLPIAGRAHGIGRAYSYKLAQTDGLPFPVLRIGKRLRVYTRGPTPLSRHRPRPPSGTHGMSRSPAERVLADAGPTIGVAETAIVLGVSKDLVRAMHRRGELDALGIRVLRLGTRIRIGTASLRRAVEVDAARPP